MVNLLVFLQEDLSSFFGPKFIMDLLIELTLTLTQDNNVSSEEVIFQRKGNEITFRFCVM